MAKNGEIERKVEELIWSTSTLCAIGGFDEAGEFTSEFFLMHIITSSLLLPSLIGPLTPSSQALLLHAYLVRVLAWWVAHGSPALNIESFAASTSTHFIVPPSEGIDSSIFQKEHSNPFLPIIRSSILHPNDHLSKIQHSFVHFGTLYGNRPAGYHKGTELEGAELLDGSLFIRATLLAANYMGEATPGVLVV
ncbi:hypothetical protein BKA82DRAFT_754145 [Pisolithus tinctorius]|uniref:Uncharacterized protein n=1 Tax=Pisolithus tinctorius Marx 270 TaxID=870435 RepID=A0A0C3NIS7_PISTI|nr:hypothetical protein BKA82DRAFT_754145 [Pisolithus tinctorius]KIO00875.1 hypothetical protein M404DRAFT_754145 [Pisolithus tinctorius Marx 270]